MLDRAALKSLRRALRRRRRQVTGTERAALEHAIQASIRRLLRSRYRIIAAYSAIDGEPDLSPLLHHPLRHGRKVYCPRVLRTGKHASMRFMPHDAPPLGRSGAVSPRRLDLVLVPLVGFDRRGNRLGFGAGFYDRTFRHLRLSSRWHKPKLVGVAFSVQEVESLPAAPWDIPLWGLITEHGFTRLDSLAAPWESSWPTG